MISMLGFLTYSRNQVWQTDVSLWQDVVKKSPHKARGYYNLGLNYDTLGDIVKAEAFYKKALEIDPNFLLALINLGIIDAENKRYDAAIKELTHASRLAPRDATTFDNLAVAYFEKGDTQNALLNFQKSMEADRYYPGVYHHVGIILRDNGRLEDSIPYFEKAISLNPYFTAAIFQLAKTQILLKRPQDAKFWIAKLEELRQGDLIAELEKLSSKRG